MKSWKKQLNDEFDAAVPALRDDVKNAPIVTAENASHDINNGNTLIKRRVGIGSVCAAALVALVFIFLAIFGVFSPRRVGGGFVFSLEINPAVSFITDGQGNVKKVNALNGDADVILSDESTLQKLKDVPLAEAVVTYTECAAKLGYLDVTKTDNAVRLSGCTEADESLISGASDSLRSFFRTNGIYAVVVEEALEAKELSVRLGVAEAETLSELTDTLDGLSVRFGERVEENASAEKLQGLYQSYIVGTQMLEWVRGELLDHVSEIISNAQMLSQMGICNYKIMTHKDNPFSPLIADYWTVKKYFKTDYTAEFAELMDEMDGLLTEYESVYGVSLESLSDLTSAADSYSDFSDIDFNELFSALTPEGFQSSADIYVGMLKNIGRDVTDLQSLLNVPQTVQEYFDQMQTALNKLFISRTERYGGVYGQEREEISEADYADFVSGIEQRYGSLENFWNARLKQIKI